MVKFALLILGVGIGSFIFATLQRRFFPQTLANGFMDLEKGEEIAPEVLKKRKPAPKK